eukprot:gene9301-biopygen783
MWLHLRGSRRCACRIELSARPRPVQPVGGGREVDTAPALDHAREEGGEQPGVQLAHRPEVQVVRVLVPEAPDANLLEGRPAGRAGRPAGGRLAGCGGASDLHVTRAAVRREVGAGEEQHAPLEDDYAHLAVVLAQPRRQLVYAPVGLVAGDGERRRRPPQRLLRRVGGGAHDANVVALPVVLVLCVGHPAVCDQDPVVGAVEGGVVRHEQPVRQADLRLSKRRQWRVGGGRQWTGGAHKCLHVLVIAEVVAREEEEPASTPDVRNVSL